MRSLCTIVILLEAKTQNFKSGGSSTSLLILNYTTKSHTFFIVKIKIDKTLFQYIIISSKLILFGNIIINT